MLPEVIQLHMRNASISPEALGIKEIQEAMENRDAHTERHLSWEHIRHSKERVLERLIRQAGNEEIQEN